MTLIKTSLLSLISTVVRVITGFVVIKVVSVYIGPTGLALVAQVQNFIGIISSISTGGVGTAVVKYTAEFRNDEKEKRKIWSNALKLSLLITVPVALLVALFSKHLSIFLLGSSEYWFVFVIFSLTSVFFAINSILLSILNGEGKIKLLTLLNIIGSILGLIVSVFLVVNFKIKGALVSLMISQFFIFFIIVGFIVKHNLVKANMFFEKLDKQNIKRLFNFSLMMLIANIGNMLVLIILRNYIGNNLGWDAAGYWQGVWKISETYLMIITTTLSIYYLPKLSSINNKEELKKEIIYGYKVIMPIVIFLALLIYLLRDFIIKVIFTGQFAPMSELFLFQLLGDVMKIASWLLGFVILAKAMTKIFIIKEITFQALFLILGYIFVKNFGLIGITQAFFVLYIIYLPIVFYIYKTYIDKLN